MLCQIVSVVGAVTILPAYVVLQREWLSARSRPYNAMNFVGAGLLCRVAVIDQHVGFIPPDST